MSNVRKEQILVVDDAVNTLEYENYYLIKPAFQFFQRRFCENGCKKVPEGFEYSSGTNTHWLTVDEMKSMC